MAGLESGKNDVFSSLKSIYPSPVERDLVAAMLMPTPTSTACSPHITYTPSPLHHVQGSFILNLAGLHHAL